MNYKDNKISFLEHRIEALENHLDKKIKQAVKIIKTTDEGQIIPLLKQALNPT